MMILHNNYTSFLYYGVLLLFLFDVPNELLLHNNNKRTTTRVVTGWILSPPLASSTTTNKKRIITTNNNNWFQGRRDMLFFENSLKTQPCLNNSNNKNRRIKNTRQYNSNLVLLSSSSSSLSSSSSSQDTTDTNNVQQVDAVISNSSINNEKYTDEELLFISNLANQCKEVMIVAADDNHNDNDNTNIPTSLLQKVIYDALPKMSPLLIMKLRQEQKDDEDEQSTSNNNDNDNNNKNNIQLVSKYMNIVMKSEIDIAKETLLTLLNAGEIRKLDNLIGKAARDGKLNVPFFNVLTANIQDSIKNKDNNDQQQDQNSNDEKDDGNTNNNSEISQQPNADRTSILRHIYTRCQEEVEKTLPPGTAFLNKLLRTDSQSIRTNLYKHYLLTPDDNDENSNVIISPDGKKIILPTTNKSLISINDYVKAIEVAIIQIRTMEKSNAMSREVSAQMVETCRTIAKETRIVLIERYGVNSTEVLDFQNQLEPIFRPKSSNSIYIQGKI